jgi:hypothetical protein
MNLLKLSFILIIALSIAACGEDEEPIITPSCTQADWIGTYTGTLNCGSGDDSTTVTITASGAEAIIIKYEIIGSQISGTITYDPMTPIGCALNFEETQQGITLKVDATLDGNNFSFRDVTTYSGGSDDCMITAIRD